MKPHTHQTKQSRILITSRIENTRYPAVIHLTMGTRIKKRHANCWFCYMLIIAWFTRAPSQLRCISKTLNTISRLIQSYAAFKSIKQTNNGSDDKLMEFCRMYIASVVERLQRKPNWLLDIILSYVSLILEITIEMIIFEHVAVIERPL